MNSKRTVRIGGKSFVLPFRAQTYWVVDAVGSGFAEANTAEIAKALVEMLNAAYPGVD